MKIATAIAAAAVAIATPAAAETINLDTNGYWTTYLDLDDATGGMYCRLVNDNDNKSITLMANETGEWGFFIHDRFEGVGQSSEVGDIVLMLRGKNTMEWTLQGSEIELSAGGIFISHIFAVDAERKQFFNDMSANNSIDLMVNGNAAIGWSLQGSAHGVSSLQECANRISGLPT
jgi:hypothetical protein